MGPRADTTNSQLVYICVSLAYVADETMDSQTELAILRKVAALNRPIQATEAGDIGSLAQFEFLFEGGFLRGTPVPDESGMLCGFELRGLTREGTLRLSALEKEVAEGRPMARGLKCAATVVRTLAGSALSALVESVSKRLGPP